MEALTVLDVLTFAASSGALACGARLIWMLSKHDTLHREHKADLRDLFKRVRHLEAQ